MANLDFHNASLKTILGQPASRRALLKLPGMPVERLNTIPGNSHPVRLMIVVTAGTDVYINIDALPQPARQYSLYRQILSCRCLYDDTQLLYVQSLGVLCYTF